MSVEHSSDHIEVIVGGHLCIDLLPRMSHVPLDALTHPGRLFEVGALDVSTGGAVSNTGLALHRLGVKVRLLSNVGDDLIGRMIVDFLNSRDPALTQHIVSSAGASSSYTIVLSPQRVDRIFLHNPGTNALFEADSVDMAVARKAKLFHLGYPPILPRFYANDGEELVKLYSRLRENGVITSLDMSLPDTASAAGRANWGEILRKTLPFVDIFIPSFEEIVFMLRPEEFQKAGSNLNDLISPSYVRDLAGQMLEMGVALAGIKCGTEGMLVCGGSAVRTEEIRHKLDLPEDWIDCVVIHPAFDVEIAGTTGAGDSAYAGFLASLVRGFSPQEAVMRACAVGACNVEAADATSGVRTWEETTRRLENEWRTRSSRLTL